MLRISRRVRCALALLACVCFPIGCEKKKNVNAVVPSGPARAGTAIIRGTVTLAGKAPAVVMIPNQPCHAGASPIVDESVVVSPEGFLRNVIVYLDDAPPAPSAGDLPPAVLDQVDCRFVPHVVALHTGQTLRFTTKDPTLHNVHGNCSVNDPFNFALVAAGQFKELKFGEAEIFQVRCDVHPWMKSWVGVFSHPYFAVTGGNGAFEIRNVPPGHYTMIAWHEKYGALRAHVDVQDGQVTVAPVTF